MYTVAQPEVVPVFISLAKNLKNLVKFEVEVAPPPI